MNMNLILFEKTGFYCEYKIQTGDQYINLYITQESLEGVTF